MEQIVVTFNAGSRTSESSASRIRNIIKAYLIDGWLVHSIHDVDRSNGVQNNLLSAIIIFQRPKNNENNQPNDNKHT